MCRVPLSRALRAPLCRGQGQVLNEPRFWEALLPSQGLLGVWQPCTGREGTEPTSPEPLPQTQHDKISRNQEGSTGVLVSEDKALEIWRVRGTCGHGNLASMPRTVFTLYYHMHGRL